MRARSLRQGQFAQPWESVDWSELDACPNCDVGAGGRCVQLNSPRQRRRERRYPHRDRASRFRVIERREEQWRS